jgi:hypothetical protein
MPVDVLASLIVLTAFVVFVATMVTLYILVESTERGRHEYEAFKEACGEARVELPIIIREFVHRKMWRTIRLWWESVSGSQGVSLGRF